MILVDIFVKSKRKAKPGVGFGNTFTVADTEQKTSHASIYKSK